MRAMNYSHTDLDGKGSIITLKSLLGEENVDGYQCDYNTINEELKKFLSNKKKLDSYDYVFITDISVDEEVAALIDELDKRDDTPFFQLLDHHGTATWLNRYEWAHVETMVHGSTTHKSSGTSLIIDFFDRQRPGFGIKIPTAVRHFAETVRRYDTWEWQTIYQETLPKELNDYFYMVGQKQFEEEMLAAIAKNPDTLMDFFDEKARALLDFKQLEIKKYIERKNKQMHHVIWDEDAEGNYTYMGVVFAEEYISELGNELCAMNPDLSFVVMVDVGHQKLSFRTIDSKLNLGEIAQKYGGGGHPKAAGATLHVDKVQDFIKAIL